MFEFDKFWMVELLVQGWSRVADCGREYQGERNREIRQCWCVEWKRKKRSGKGAVLNVVCCCCLAFDPNIRAMVVVVVVVKVTMMMMMVIVSLTITGKVMMIV